ncbi:hypothetical protein GZH49_02820 [Nocardia terpenica]|uniref:hypothetical protein n=1 Tax=Nocardia terpenica TaxID=455432 RepID=UPI002FE29B80
MTTNDAWTPTQLDPDYYAERGSDESRMRAAFARVHRLHERARTAKSVREFEDCYRKADAIETRWTRDVDATADASWRYLRRETALWEQHPERAQAVFELLQDERAEFGVALELDPETDADVAMTDSHYHSVLQARELTGHGAWTIPQRDLGRDESNDHRRGWSR